jgi:hypothetical protein
LLIQGFMRMARAQPDASAWLTAKHTEATLAVAAGDMFVTSHSFKGQAGTTERQIPAATLLQIYEVCLQQLDAESSAAQGIYAAPGSVRHADFSAYPSTLG